MSETSGWIEANIPAQDGKLFLVTGANSGLGYEVSRALAHRGATVVMACRSPEEGEGAANVRIKFRMLYGAEGTRRPAPILPQAG